jgi:hypothetical protein
MATRRPVKECPAIGKLSGPRLYQANYWTPPRAALFLPEPPLIEGVACQYLQAAGSPPLGLDFRGAAGRDPGMREGFCVLESRGRCPGGLKAVAEMLR